MTLTVQGRIFTLTFEIRDDSAASLSLCDGESYMSFTEEIVKECRRIAEETREVFPEIGDSPKGREAIGDSIRRGLVARIMRHADSRTLAKFMGCGTWAFRIAVEDGRVTFRLPRTMALLSRLGLSGTGAWVGGLGVQHGYIYRDALNPYINPQAPDWPRAFRYYPGEMYAEWIDPPREAVLTCRDPFPRNTARRLLDGFATRLDVEVCRWVYESLRQRGGMWSVTTEYHDWCLLVNPELLGTLSGTIRIANLQLLGRAEVSEWFSRNGMQIEKLRHRDMQITLPHDAPTKESPSISK